MKVNYKLDKVRELASGDVDFIAAIAAAFLEEVPEAVSQIEIGLKDNDFTHKPLLTKREKEVFELLVQDKTTKEIASDLFISEKTVRNQVSNAMQKLGVKGRSQAVVELLRMGELKL